MKKLFLFLFITAATTTMMQAQSVEELQATQAEKIAQAEELQAQVDALMGESNDIQSQLDKLVGWRKGFNGQLGFDFNKSSGWIANPNPDASSSSLNLGLNGYALKDSEKTFWHNKGIINKSWQDVDLSQDDTGGVKEDDGLFDNGTVDILNLSSLAGYKLSDKFALSGQGEVNTSLGNFLKPGTFDLGVGATWLPIENMTVVIHPLNYRYAWAADGTTAESTGSVGAKVRADYTKEFDVNGRTIAWNSTLTTFLPYKENDPSLNELTWINSFAFEIWNGIGVGLTYGIRNAKFESEDTQSFTSLGLSYGF